MAETALEKITRAADELRELGPHNEELGQLSGEAARLLRNTGAVRMLQPAAWGGQEAHPREFAEAVMRTAAADGASGWVHGIVGVHPWEMAFADPKVQEEVWGDDPDTWIASPYAPMGVATPVEGGYLLTGHWQFSSGTDQCQWIFLGGFLGNPDGTRANPPESLHLILPRSDYEIVEDSWDVVGLGGTGSKDIVVKDAFVPEYRTLPYEKVADGTAAKEAGLRNPLYRMPFSCAFPLGITAAVIGIAEGGLALHRDYQRNRVTVTGTRIKDDPHSLYALSEAAAEIDASRAALLENACRMYDTVAAGRDLSFEQRAVGRRVQVGAAWRAVRALDEVFARSGGNAMRRENPLQRFWRDAHTGLAHAIHVPGSVFHASALTELDVDPPPGPMRSMI